MDVNTANGGTSPADPHLFEPSSGTRHNLCSAGSWLNGWNPIDYGSGSFHPKQAGLDNEGALAAGFIARLNWANLAQPTTTVSVAPVSANGLPKAGATIVSGGVAQDCSAGSDSAGQAYRCFTASGIYDPCWLDNADPAQASVLCQQHPWDTQVIRFTVASGGLPPFPGPAQPAGLNAPWGVQLADGERCIALQGAHSSYAGKVIDYACGTGYAHVLLGTLNRSSAQWTYQSAYSVGASSYRAGPLEFVTTAWYASPDNGAAAGARASACTATALAYAAQAYETAHNDPNGSLPEINAQACDAGYAEFIFTQPAPPPGYTATYAFRASRAGWQEIGNSDFIPPGQFGIPVNVGKAINNSLSSAPRKST